jgi:hypothetical protein
MPVGLDLVKYFPTACLFSVRMPHASGAYYNGESHTGSNNQAGRTVLTQADVIEEPEPVCAYPIPDVTLVALPAPPPSQKPTRTTSIRKFVSSVTRSPALVV